LGSGFAAMDYSHRKYRLKLKLRLIYHLVVTTFYNSTEVHIFPNIMV